MGFGPVPIVAGFTLFDMITGGVGAILIVLFVVQTMQTARLLTAEAATAK